MLPSGCSHVIVPVDVIDTCGAPLPICIVIAYEQSYCARPCSPFAVKRSAPVMCCDDDAVVEGPVVTGMEYVPDISR